MGFTCQILEMRHQTDIAVLYEVDQEDRAGLPPQPSSSGVPEHTDATPSHPQPQITFDGDVDMADDDDDTEEEDCSDLTDDESSTKQPVVECVSAAFFDDNNDMRYCRLCK